MKPYWLLLFLFLTPAQAEIYRWVDADGNVIYSDEPHPDAETVDLPEATVYTPVGAEQESEAEILKLSPEQEDDSSTPDIAYQLRIIAPANDESIWVNNGSVTVSLVLEPELNAERGDKILVTLDGEAVGEPQAATTIQLTNLNRGTHTLSASVVDANGATLTSSSNVSFHLHRTSVLNRNNTN
jgi:hypothetical protein